MIGRTQNASGTLYTVDYPIQNSDTFFKEKHTAIAIYNPDPENGNGYLELYVDGYFGGRQYFGKETIWKDYNSFRNITLGKSGHGNATHFKGNIYNIRIRQKNFLKSYEKIYLQMEKGDETIEIPFFTQATTTLTGFEMHADEY